MPAPARWPTPRRPSTTDRGAFLPARSTAGTITWNERFRRGDYPTDPGPADLLRRRVDTFPDGRALDVATGTDRNAVFLADHGHEVDADALFGADG